MDERVPSPARSPLPISSYMMKIEKDIDPIEQKEEANPFEQEDELMLLEPDICAFEPDKDFIQTFETLRLLWDPKHPHYTNKFKRNKALTRLVPILNISKPGSTILDVKKKINSIRSNYRRELRKVITSQRSETGEIYRPTIWYFPYLDFLRKLEERTSGQTIDLNYETFPKQEPNEALSQPGPLFSSMNVQESKQMLQEPKKTILGQLLNNTRQILPKPCADLRQPKKISDHVVLEWVDTLEKLDPLQRLYAKKAINDVLFEAELGNLHKHSVKINEPAYGYSSMSPAPCSTVKSPPDESP